MEYDFELKFALPADGVSGREWVERIGEAGCDDATVGIGQPGRIAMSFTREAGSARHAVLSALREVKKIIPGAVFIEAGPDFVSLTDIADRVGVTRQNMRKLMLAYPESFPAPVHEGSAAFWHLAPVLRWLEAEQGYVIEKSLMDVAHMAMQINLVKDASGLDSSTREQITTLVVAR